MADLESGAAQVFGYVERWRGGRKEAARAKEVGGWRDAKVWMFDATENGREKRRGEEESESARVRWQKVRKRERRNSDREGRIDKAYANLWYTAWCGIGPRGVRYKEKNTSSWRQAEGSLQLDDEPMA